MVDHVCVLDFEATCWQGSKEHEIIEFPSILWRWEESKDFHKVSEIQLYVKPSHNPSISDFCHNLTGISQEQVDVGVSLEEALVTHHKWLCDHVQDLGSLVFVTCGNWDLASMLPSDIKRNKLSYPSPVYRRFVNLKPVFSHVTKTPKILSMVKMLKALNLELEGRHHSGIDDCKNISNIFAKLVQLGLKKDKFMEFSISINWRQVDYICVLDFEATCWEGSKEHEIIEFPSVLWRWDKKSNFHKISEIQLFVKPSSNPNLSEFCKNLTGITQEQVNIGIPLKEALKSHYKWVSDHVLDLDSLLIVTCGNWDLATMLPRDIAANKLSYPSPVYRRYVNLKQVFGNITNTRKSFTMTEMLGALNLQLEGRHHSGIDDCRNISRIFEKLIQLGLKKDDFMEFIVEVR